MVNELDADAFDFSVIKPTEPEKKHKKKKAKKPAVSKSESAASTDISQADEGGDNTAGTEKNEDEKEPAAPKGQNGIWVGNFNFSTTQKMVMDYFASCGKITRLRMPMSTPKKNKGFAFVDFDTSQAMSKAICLSETELDGRKLLIKSAQDFSTTGIKPRGSSKPVATALMPVEINSSPADYDTDLFDADDIKRNQKTVMRVQPKQMKPSRKLFIGNLSFTTTADKLEKFFGKHGEVEEVRMSEFEDTGRCKGFAHVIYTTQESADKAMKQCPIKMDGRVLRVEYGQHEERAPKTAKRKEVKLALPSEKRQKITFDDDSSDDQE